MKIGFFGGSFNPPTKAHLEIAKKVSNKFNLDSTYFVPMGNSYIKPGLIDEKHRYNMLNLICNKEEKINVENIELNRKEHLSTIEAFKIIESKYLNSENYYIMGADNFVKLPTWQDAENLIKNYKYIVFERDGIDIKSCIKENELLTKYIKNIHILKLDENPQCHAGMIRQAIQEGKYENLENLTHQEVIDYIKENRLYQTMVTPFPN